MEKYSLGDLQQSSSPGWQRPVSSRTPRSRVRGGFEAYLVRFRDYSQGGCDKHSWYSPTLWPEGPEVIGVTRNNWRASLVKHVSLTPDHDRGPKGPRPSEWGLPHLQDDRYGEGSGPRRPRRGRSSRGLGRRVGLSSAASSP